MLSIIYSAPFCDRNSIELKVNKAYEMYTHREWRKKANKMRIFKQKINVETS